MHRDPVANKQGPPQRAVWRWLLVVFYLGCIFVASATPGDALPDFKVSDKLLHALEFGVLSVLLCRAVVVHVWTRPRYVVVVISLLLTVIYGAFDEVHQLFVPQRVSSVWDLLADAIGAMLGGWLWLTIHRK